MMALANLLEHPTIKPELIEGTTTKRSNKDLGRVLALARFTTEEDLERWPAPWLDALKDRFPKGWREMARRTGDGLGRLLASPPDLQQGNGQRQLGPLANRNVTAEQLRARASVFLHPQLTSCKGSPQPDATSTPITSYLTSPPPTTPPPYSSRHSTATSLYFVSPELAPPVQQPHPLHRVLEDPERALPVDRVLNPGRAPQRPSDSPRSRPSSSHS